MERVRDTSVTRLEKFKNIVLLKQIAEKTNRSNGVYYAIDEKTHKKYVIKMLNKKSYRKEKANYLMIKERGLEHIFTKMKYHDDENCLIIMKAGNCDLNKFCKLRQKAQIKFTKYEIGNIF